jgi:tagatose-6-phosphate ketose/aldose isomerase
VLADAADLPDAALALPSVIFAQLLALHSSAALGLTADNPFPSGEVNRVVQGVRIHAFDRAR